MTIEKDKTFSEIIKREINSCNFVFRLKKSLFTTFFAYLNQEAILFIKTAQEVSNKHLQGKEKPKTMTYLHVRAALLKLRLKAIKIHYDRLKENLLSLN